MYLSCIVLELDDEKVSVMEEAWVVLAAFFRADPLLLAGHHHPK